MGKTAIMKLPLAMNCWAATLVTVFLATLMALVVINMPSSGTISSSAEITRPPHTLDTKLVFCGNLSKIRTATTTVQPISTQRTTPTRPTCPPPHAIKVISTRQRKELLACILCKRTSYSLKRQLTFAYDLQCLRPQSTNSNCKCVQAYGTLHAIFETLPYAERIQLEFIPMDACRVKALTLDELNFKQKNNCFPATRCVNELFLKRLSPQSTAIAITSFTTTLPKRVFVPYVIADSRRGETQNSTNVNGKIN